MTVLPADEAAVLDQLGVDLDEVGEARILDPHAVEVVVGDDEPARPARACELDRPLALALPRDREEDRRAERPRGLPDVHAVRVERAVRIARLRHRPARRLRQLRPLPEATE